MTRPLLSLAVALAALAAAGCRHHDEQEPPPSCEAPADPALPPSPNLAARLFDDYGDPEAPLSEGGQAQLVRGPQGGYMLVLTLRLEDGPPGERVCGRLRLSSESLASLGEAYTGDLEQAIRVDFDAAGAARVGNVQWLLGWSDEPLRGTSFDLALRFEADGWLAEERLGALTIR